MPRLIDADALETELKETKIGLAIDKGKMFHLIEDAPTVDAVEVVHGVWEPRKDVPGFVNCSVCHNCNIYDDWPDGKKWNYCPNCGAKNGDGNG